jgi:hypothetical protein
MVSQQMPFQDQMQPYADPRMDQQFWPEQPVYVSSHFSDQPPPWRQCIGRWFVQSDAFQTLIALVIICNCVIMGLETDFPSRGELWNLLERICLGIFVFEISMRVIFRGWLFFLGNDVGWNVFDLVIVMAGIVDTLLEILDPADMDELGTSKHRRNSLASISVILRAFRLLRILRVFRLFKMLTQLYTLVMGFMESLVSVFWVSVLCTLCLFICGVFLTRTLGRPLGLEALQSGSLDDTDHDDALFFVDSFGTVPQSMFTLFTLMATPDLTRMEIAMSRSLGVTLFFIGWVVFGSFAMISILTGVISESMVAKGQVRRENMRFEEEEKLKVLREKLRNHFKEYDSSGDGLLSREEFIAAIPAMVELLQNESDDDNVVYNESDLVMVYDLMDLDGSGEIDTDEFLKGMEQFDCRLHQVPLQIMKFQANLMKRHNALSGEVREIKSYVKEIHGLLHSQLG